MNHPSTRIAGSAIGFFNKVESVADQTISELPGMSDDEVLEVRQNAVNFGMVSWRIEIACDAEVARRSQPRQARGRYDLEGQQISKAVQEYAHMLGVSSKTVHENAGIHETYFSSLSAQTREIHYGAFQHLQQKDFYRAAYYTDDPWGTLERFAQEKLENPFFSTRDAWRMTKEDKAPPLDTTVPALCDDPEVVKAWEDFQSSCRLLITAAPRLQGLVNGYLEEIQYELTLPPQTVKVTIFELIRQGYDEADMIAVRMKRDRIYVIVWLNRLVELGELESFEKERAPGARGAARTGYREI